MHLFQKWTRIGALSFALFAITAPTANAEEHPALNKLFDIMFEMTERCFGCCHLDFNQDFTLMEVAQNSLPEIVYRDRVIAELEETIEFFLDIMDEVAYEEADSFREKISEIREQASQELAEALGTGSYRFYKDFRQLRSGHDRWQLYFVGDSYRLKIEYGAAWR